MLRASARAGIIRLMMRAEPSERCLYNDDDKLDVFSTICNPFMHWVHHSCPLFHQLILFPFANYWTGLFTSSLILIHINAAVNENRNEMEKRPSLHP